MLTRHSHPLITLLVVLDALLAALAFMAAYLVRFYTPVFGPGAVRIEDYLLALPVVTLTAVGAFYAAGLYEPEIGSGRPSERWTTGARGAVLAALLILALSAVYRRASYSRALLAVYFALLVVGLPLMRVAARRILSVVRGRKPAHGAIVVGEGEVAREVVAGIQGRPWTGVEVVGTVAVPGETSTTGDLAPSLGTVDDLEQIVQARPGVVEVFVALPLEQSERLLGLETALRSASADLHVVLDPRGFMRIRPRADMLGGLPVLTIRGGPGYGWNRLLKRTVDVVGATVGLALSAPVMALCATLIKLSSKGPILYRQTRISWGGRAFTMYKLRTMREDAETGGAQFTEAQDPRVTRLGRFLRRTSLDEVPQFWNVLRGDMSLVGPRPERPEHLPRIQGWVPHYPLRLSVKAGLTGWAQINGARQNLSFDDRIQLDLYYVEHWSLWLDLQIMIRTVLGGFLRNAQ